MAIQKYEAFHGRPIRSHSERRIHIPDCLIRLGDAYAIEYVCDKWNGGGDGKKAVYRHKFSPGAKLYMDERGKKQLYIIGSKITVDEGGIRN